MFSYTYQSGRYGPCRYQACLRHDLHQALLKYLPPDSIRLNSRFVGCTQDSAGVKLFLENGDVVEGDMLVGADGVRSVIRKSLHKMYPSFLGAEPPVVYSGTSMWGGMIKDLSSVQHIIRGTNLMDDFAWHTNRDGRIFITFPCNKVLGWSYAVQFASEQDKNSLLATYPTPQTLKRYLQEQVSCVSSTGSGQGKGNGFPAHAEALVGATTMDPFRWDIYSLQRNPHKKGDTSDRYGYGNITLLGDAAHAITPWVGQGAGMSIEDAYDLAYRLSQLAVIEPSSTGGAIRNIGISEAIRSYERFRIPRNSKMMVTAKANQGMYFLNKSQHPILGWLRFRWFRLLTHSKRVIHHFMSWVYDFDAPNQPLVPTATVSGSNLGSR